VSRFPHCFINLGRYVAQDKLGSVAAENRPIWTVQQLVDFMLSENRRTSLAHWIGYLGGGTMPGTVDAGDAFTQRLAGGLSEQPEGLTEFASHIVLFIRSHFRSFLVLHLTGKARTMHCAIRSGSGSKAPQRNTSVCFRAPLFRHELANLPSDNWQIMAQDDPVKPLGIDDRRHAHGLALHTVRGTHHDR
jgi:hypothetical protein